MSIHMAYSRRLIIIGAIIAPSLVCVPHAVADEPEDGLCNIPCIMAEECLGGQEEYMVGDDTFCGPSCSAVHSFEDFVQWYSSGCGGEEEDPDCVPDNIEEVAARYVAAAPRHGLEFV